MEFGTLERRIHIDASPDVVFEVISRPEHIEEWWADEASLGEPAPGVVGELVWGDREHVATMTVVDADPPRRFSFRWVAPEGEPAAPGNSLLVTFELSPSRGGTLLLLTETGFREKGWEIAVLEEQYRDHENGWDAFLPRLASYAGGLVPR
ncbi:polyketide cyclase [Jiangella ureilytica]|uniref:Polyketide cyclase n=1 Tax=Jiangella ureilytica TaxID=2530374 RepID=A0A4R4RI12_9ACTN|nr:SRPBCC family protein [Jiangella ureilytica]TDC48926.1 polyketide cyclase [Jiangella ureilytica]